jgi:recombination protein RecA
LQGMEASGKSLIVAHALANTQKKGGLAVYIDTENALSEEFLTAVGVDVANMLYVPLETIEDSFEAVENIIETVRKSSKNRLVTIALDSVSAATTKIEQDADYDKDGWATSKAILMSKAMRKITNIIAKQRVLLICTSQLREKMGVMFGDKWTTSGGKALGFHASCRIRLKGIGKLKSGSGKTEQIIGVQTEAQVIKNRMGPPFKKATFDIFFSSGIDDVNSWLTMMKDYGMLKVSGAYYTLVNEDTGEEIRFMSKDWRGMLVDDEELKQYCYKKICDIFIMKYKTQDLSPDDISVDDGELID